VSHTQYHTHTLARTHVHVHDYISMQVVLLSLFTIINTNRYNHLARHLIQSQH